MKKIILVVDDSKLSRMLVTTIVNTYSSDWVVFTAGSADEAINKAKEHSLTAVSLDYNMPGQTGLDIVPELKVLQPNARIALLTANIQKSIKNRAEELGVTFIPKPVTEEKVIAFLNKVEKIL